MQCYRTAHHIISEAVCCCPDCGSIDVFRRSSRFPIAHWRCRSCDHRWRLPHAHGLGKACNAKLVAADCLDPPSPGSGMRRARIRCCAACSSTRVRPTTASGCIRYWHCERCGQGWSEAGAGTDHTLLNVKLVRPVVERDELTADSAVDLNEPAFAR